MRIKCRLGEVLVIYADTCISADYIQAVNLHGLNLESSMANCRSASSRVSDKDLGASMRIRLTDAFEPSSDVYQNVRFCPTVTLIGIEWALKV